MNLFLDKNRADGVFALLFSFAFDQACGDEDFCSFDQLLIEVLGGTRVSEAVRERLRPIYERARAQKSPLSNLLSRVTTDFSDDRDSLVSLLSILLRLSSSEGMLYNSDKQRMKQVIEAFDFCGSELETLSDSDKAILELCYSAEQKLPAEYCEDQMLEYFRILDCSPEAPVSEVRKMYRKLAKRYHPDKQKAGASEQALQKSRLKFEKIQFAYEQIKARQKIQKAPGEGP